MLVHQKLKRCNNWTMILFAIAALWAMFIWFIKPENLMLNLLIFIVLFMSVFISDTIANHYRWMLKRSDDQEEHY